MYLNISAVFMSQIRHKHAQLDENIEFVIKIKHSVVQMTSLTAETGLKDRVNQCSTITNMVLGVEEPRGGRGPSGWGGGPLCVGQGQAPAPPSPHY